MTDGALTTRQYRVDGSATEVSRAIPLILAENHRHRLSRRDSDTGAVWELLPPNDPTPALARIAVTSTNEQDSLLILTPLAVPAPAFTSFEQRLRKALTRYGFSLDASGDTSPQYNSEAREEVPTAKEADGTETVNPHSENDVEETSQESEPEREAQSPEEGELPPIPPPKGPRENDPLPERMYTVRQHIYRKCALDDRAAPESRLHAARVLASGGDTETAARTFATLTQHVAASAALVQAAFDAIIELGQEGLSGLWTLDALETDLHRLIGIAGHLAALGDPETARIRLEGIARFGTSDVRREAITTLIDHELLPARQLASLMRKSSMAPEVRLAAATRLLQRSDARQAVIQTLKALTQVDDSATAEAAVGTLVSLDDNAARRALVPVAAQAPYPSVRLRAARALLDAGATNVARRTLRTLAAGDVDEVALDAFELLQTIPSTADRDAEHLARDAALPAVQRRAASSLTGPEMPDVVQQVAADTLIRLGYTSEAIPVLIRLLHRSANDSRLRRWVIAQLRNLEAEGEELLLDALHAEDDPSRSATLVDVTLRVASAPATRRQVAAWLLSHQQPRWAIEVLEGLACDESLSNQEARAATLILQQAFEHAPNATVSALERIVHTSPHSGARAEARQILLRRQPGVLSLDVLIDALSIEEQVPDTLKPALEQLRQVAPDAAQAISTRLLHPNVNPQSRWRLFTLLTQLPDDSTTPVLTQIVSRAPTAAVALAGAEELFDRGETETAVSVLGSLATSAPSAEVRRRAVYRLHDQYDVLRTIAKRTPFDDTRAQIRSLLPKSAPQARLEHLWLRLEEWIERLGLSERER